MKIPNRGGTFGLDESAIANQESEAKRSLQAWLQAVKSGATASYHEWSGPTGLECGLKKISTHPSAFGSVND